jgi:hypothetical protein
MDYSMFGAMLPQQAQEEDMRSRMVSPNTFAQLNPLQQIVALGGNAGAMVGGAVGNMMGGRTSKEAEGAMIKEIFDKASQMSEDPAEQYAFASKEFRRLGMNDRAMALEDRAGGLAEKRDARNAGVAAVESRTRALLSKDPNMNPEVAQSLAQDPAAWRKAMEDSKIKYSSDVEEISAELFGKPFNQLSPTEAGQVNQLRQQRGVNKATAGASRIVNSPNLKMGGDAVSLMQGIANLTKPEQEMLKSAQTSKSLINEAAASNNSQTWEAARTQIAKAVGEGKLSNEDIRRTGIDPRLVQGALDWVNKKTVGVPNQDIMKQLYVVADLLEKQATNRINTTMTQARTLATDQSGVSPAAAETIFPMVGGGSRGSGGTVNWSDMK